MAFQLTQEQQQAVDNRGGALLVSAAAGSGKTRVLVERLMDRVCNGADIDRFLIITYTKAAAAELRSRIAKELNERLALCPQDRHLRRQTTLLYRAQISTVHAFCAQLLRENAAQLDLDPDFRLCDEGESLILMDQILSRLMDERYEALQPGAPFADLVDALSGGRDDSRLMQIVLDIFGRVQSHADPEGWLREQQRLWQLENVADVTDTPWGQQLMELARQRAAYYCARLEKAWKLAQQDKVVSANFSDSLQQSMDALAAFGRMERWDDMAAALPIPFPRAGGKRGVEDVLCAERVKNIRARAKKQLDKLNEWFDQPNEVLMVDLHRAAPAVRELMELVLDFGRAFREEKRRRGLVDFSDLEHLTVELLYDSATGQYSDLARSCSARFDEVLVDEFQDTNQVQNAIFRAVSDGGRTSFTVGDVKQSIYRFRLADPTIFLQRYDTFPLFDKAKKGEGRKVLLTQNFRSRAQVLEGVNDLFRDLMSRDLGELEYTDEQALVPGSTAFPEAGDWRVALDVVETGGDPEEDLAEDKNLLEARCVAARIRRMLDEGMQVGQKDNVHTVRPGDIMLLLRSPGPVLAQYITALEEQGIPWSAPVGEELFATTQVNVALALLQIVDNPHQDVALIAALRSPVFAFSADRLAQLRARSKGDFYDAVVQAAQAGEQDCVEFLRQLDELRFGAGERTCSQLIWHIYEKTNLLGLFSVMPGGGERRAHLLALYELARQQEGLGCRTLFDFLTRLERLRAQGRQVSLSTAKESQGVRIMSIHRSKGLEAPVVFVCGLARRFNRDDMKRPVLFHTTHGVGPKYLDREENVEVSTLARHVVAQTLDREMLSEELRLLYVAMTRAQEKLILTMSVASAEKVLSGLAEDADSPVAPQALAECDCMGKWILLSALTRSSGTCLRQCAGLGFAVTEDYTYPWDIRIVPRWELVEGEESAEQSLPVTLPEPQSDWLKHCFDWRYPYACDRIPSKLTATQLKGRAKDQEAAEQTAAQPSAGGVPLYRPRFAAEKLGLTAAQRGTAMHQVMEYLDFAHAGTREELAEQIEQLVAGEYITAEQAQATDVERLCALFASPLGQELLQAQVNREFKFSMLVPAQEYFPDAAGEELLLQGVVDCWFETPEGITVVDFKSDRVSEQTVESRVREYLPQLETYARALTRLTDRPVTRRVLWFFALDRAVEV